MKRRVVEGVTWSVRIGLLIFSFYVGILVFWSLILVPVPELYSWNFLSWNHVSILPIVLFAISVTMLAKLFRNTRYDRRIMLSVIALVVACSLALYPFHTLDSGNVSFDPVIVMKVMVSIWVLALLPILRINRTAAGGSIEKRGTDYALLATSVMWLAPLLTEMLVWLDWSMRGILAEKIKDSVLGGYWLNDFLFIPGFATLLSLGLYALIAPKTIDRLQHKKS